MTTEIHVLWKEPFKNFATVLKSNLFKKSFSNTVIIWIMNFIPQMGLALLLTAWFTDRRSKVKGQGLFKILFYMPNIITAATVAILFTQIFGYPSGPVNATLIKMGLSEKGIDFTRIINETYYTRTYTQTLVTGYVMMNSKLALDGKVVYSYLTPEDMDHYSVTSVELSSVIDTLREVTGTEVAIFLYPVNGEYKISLRSNYVVDVNKVAGAFGGGGHVRAAGGNSKDSPEETIAKLLKLIQEQL